MPLTFDMNILASVMDNILLQITLDIPPDFHFFSATFAENRI